MKPMGRILGLDFGEARVGLAVSDETGTIAFPLPAWERKNQIDLLAYLGDLTKAEEIQKIVLGFPRHLDGSVGKTAEQVLAFKEELTKDLGLPVDLWDERLSSVSARRVIQEQKKKTKRDKKVVDTISAVLILQNYLDSHRK